MPFVSFFPFSLVSKATAMCEERSCEPPLDIRRFSRRAPLKLTRAPTARQAGQWRTNLQVQTGRRGTSISDYLFYANEIRGAFPIVFSSTTINECTEQRRLKQSWGTHPHNHRFFTSGIGPGVGYGGLVMRGVTRLQYKRCTF
jgi:hypothetical protein